VFASEPTPAHDTHRGPARELVICHAARPKTAPRFNWPWPMTLPPVPREKQGWSGLYAKFFLNSRELPATRADDTFRAVKLTMESSKPVRPLVLSGVGAASV
jgi:hypothetical protein